MKRPPQPNNGKTDRQRGIGILHLCQAQSNPDKLRQALCSLRFLLLKFCQGQSNSDKLSQTNFFLRLESTLFPSSFPSLSTSSRMNQITSHPPSSTIHHLQNPPAPVKARQGSVQPPVKPENKACQTLVKAKNSSRLRRRNSLLPLRPPVQPFLLATVTHGNPR